MTLKELVRADVLKYCREANLKTFLSCLVKVHAFRYVLCLRLLRQYPNNKMLKIVVGGVKSYLSSRYSLYMGAHIPLGPGFVLGHGFSTIVDAERIGANVKIMQQVTIGRSVGGSRAGVPTIGNNVFVAAGAKIIGRVRIGNNVVIGANAVVTKDVPDGAIVGGVPAKILSYDGETQATLWCGDAKYMTW